MESLFDTEARAHIQTRLAQLKPDSAKQWGTMSPAQAAAHCAAGLEMALGEVKPPRVFLGRMLGWLIKPLALRPGARMRPNSPSMPALVIHDQPDFGTERDRLRSLIDRFAQSGAAGCTTHPHAFFGRLAPNEWGVLMYKHLDHHLRQFGV